ncbi:hypothetical protein DPMN_182154 [Dreissena polymorpha]|uniref:C1q domain-containing protein n=2 Tax=Dreissena polymorpha TaxID=45954 RepID=A0A9D4DFW1_DREPO|nr:hypothetical protein DPMN_182154 [Dreissena polymorpha]
MFQFLVFAFVAVTFSNGFLEQISSECTCVLELQQLAGQLTTLQNAVGSLSTKQALIDALMKNISAMEQQLSHLNQVLHNPQAVAFTAQLSHDMTNIGANQPVVFDHVVTNPGNSYDKTTGHFTAPQNGLYIFYLTITSYANYGSSFYLIKNSHSLLAITSTPTLVHGNQTNPETNTHVITEQLHAGDQVWVQNGRFNPHEGLGGNDQTSFSGHMITPYFSP